MGCQAAPRGFLYGSVSCLMSSSKPALTAPPPQELVSALSSFPDDLDKSYQRLIDRIPVEYRIETYIFIETVYRNEGELGLRDLGLVLLCALGRTVPDSGSRLPPDPYSDDFLNATRRRLQSRCGGLLEVLPDTSVQFMHQTVKEFFSRPGSSEDIVGHDPKLWRENGFSFLTKFYATLMSMPSPSDNGFDWRSYAFSMYNVVGHTYVLEPHYRAAIACIIPSGDSYDRRRHPEGFGLIWWQYDLSPNVITYGRNGLSHVDY